MSSLKRTVGALALAGITAVLLAACGSSSSSGSSGSTGTSGTNKTLTIAIDSNVATLDPAATQSVGTDLSVIGSIYSSLVTRTPGLSLQPNLATSWKQDGTTWTFQLNPNAKFANGDPLNASVVKWNFDRVLDKSKAYRASAALRGVVSVQAPSAHTVTITTATPDFKLPADLTYLFFLDPSWAKTHDPATEAMGSGPYKLVNFGGGQTVQLTKSSAYWGTPASIENVTFQAVPDDASRVSGILSGSIDLATTLSPTDAKQLAGNANVVVASQESVNTDYFMLNTLEPPMNNVLLRQAANYAVDKNALAESILGGLTKPNDGQVVSSTEAGFDAGIKGYPYDPAKAKALLAEAGYKGQSIEMDVPTGAYLNAPQIGQAVAAQLEAVGFKINLQTMPFTVYLTKFVTNRDMAPISYIRTLEPSQTVAGTYTFFFSTTSPYSYFHNAEFDGLVAKALDAKTTAERDQLLGQAGTLFRNEAPVIFLFQEPSITARVKSLEWTPTRDGWLLPADMSWQ